MSDTTGWRPIATAPQDGTSVLLVRASAPSVVCSGHYRQHHIFDEERDWVGCIIKHPTHWMPLPPPPGATP